MIKPTTVLLALVLSLGALAQEPPAFPDAQAAINATRAALRAKDPGAAQAAVEAAAALEPKPNQEIDLWLLRADIAEANGDRAAARNLYQRLYADAERDLAVRLRGGLALGASYVKGQEEVEALALYQEMLALPGLDDKGQRTIELAVASAHATFGAWAASSNDLAKVRDHAAAAMEISRRYQGDGYPTWLLANLANRARKQALNELAIFAGDALLAAPKADPRSSAKVIPTLVEAYLGTGQIPPALTVLAAAVANEAYEPGLRYQWATTRNALQAVDAGEALAEATLLPTPADGFVPTRVDQLAALSLAASSLNAAGAYPRCRQVVAMIDTLLAVPPSSEYLCRYAEEAPLGVGGWLLSGLVDDPAYREDRFEPYDLKDSDRLVADITAERLAGTPEKLKPYLRNTAFSMVYDTAGWHIFVRCGEPEIDRLLADGAGAGALEMYFQAGEGSTYAQWIVSLPEGKVDSFDWDSPRPRFRPLADYIDVRTMVHGTDLGTYIFIPWEAVYDRLPFTGEVWRFGLIRWSLGGGLTWGGNVHELNEFGRIRWQPPTAEQRAAIQRRLLRRAWSKFRASSQALLFQWADREIGDPAFAERVLQPEVDRLTRLGEPLANLEALTPQQLDTLYPEATAAWMEFGYRTAELRRRYLMDSLLGGTTPPR